MSWESTQLPDTTIPFKGASPGKPEHETLSLAALRVLILGSCQTTNICDFDLLNFDHF